MRKGAGSVKELGRVRRKSIKVKVGHITTNEEVIHQLKSRGIYFDYWTEKMILSCRIRISRQRVIYLVITCPVELGIEREATYQEIQNEVRCEHPHFKFYPFEVAPSLRLNYMNQPDKERLIVFSQPICCGDVAPRMFVVGRNGKIFLTSRYVSERHPFSPTDSLVFCVS